MKPKYQPNDLFQSAESAPLKWRDYKFPRWVPEDVRNQIREFWAEEYGRSPRAWQESFRFAYADHAPFGARVKCRPGWNGQQRIRAGRWVPMWNNIGRLICRNRQVIVYSTDDIIRKENKL